MRQLIVFCIALFLIALYDGIWLGFVASSFYKHYFGMLGCATLTGVGTKWWSVILTYCIMALGFVFFVYPRLSLEPSLMNIGYGALFGLVLFGVYQGTNYVVFRDWPLMLFIVDTAWGMFTYALTSCVTMGIMRTLIAYGWI